MMTRREMVAGTGATLALGGVISRLMAQTETLGTSRVFHASELKQNPSSNGGWSRAVMEGTLPTGEHLEVHETFLPAGKMPHPPHRHSNSEVILVREGEIEYLTDGKVERLGPRDVIYTASGRPHGMRNVGTTPAQYFVVSVGAKDKAIDTPLKPAGVV